MSTNYYFEIKDEFLNDTLDRLELSIFINPKDIFRIKNDLKYLHIGKRSGGWKPLFQKTRFYESMSTLKKFYQDNKDQLIIKDEYKEPLTWDELDKNLFQWNGGDYTNLCKTHLSLVGLKVYVDKDGYEWGECDFS